MVYGKGACADTIAIIRGQLERYRETRLLPP
jgi:hypothetical protein